MGLKGLHAGAATLPRLGLFYVVASSAVTGPANSAETSLVNALPHRRSVSSVDPLPWRWNVGG